MPKLTVKEVIKLLGLAPLPHEGGFYRQTFQSREGRRETCLPFRFVETTKGRIFRPDGTAIYYLVMPDNFSALHRLKGTEIWHFYAGDPVEMLQLVENDDLEVRELFPAESRVFTIGADLLIGQRPQIVVPPLVWQGTRLKTGGDWALLGCTTTPGYHNDDFELGDQAKLVAKFPQFEDNIRDLTRE